MTNNGNIRFETVMVTPQQAQTWLDKNRKDNRKLSNQKVKEYMNEIRAGRWRYTHQGIAFDTEGYLIDGQHRLAAVREAGIATKMVVAYGVDRGEFTIIDRGFPRNMMIITGIDKYFTECYIFLITVATRHAQRPMPDDVFQLHKNLGSNLKELHDYCSAKVRVFTSAPFRTAALVAMQSGEDKIYVLNTYRELAAGRQSMPIVAFTLFKSKDELSRSYGWRGRFEMYFKARYVFTKEKSEIDRITINENLENKYYKEASDIVSQALVGSPDMEKNALLKIIEEKDKQIEKDRQKYIKALSQNLESDQIRLSKEARD